MADIRHDTRCLSSSSNCGDNNSEVRPTISIWIPTAFLADPPKSSSTVASGGGGGHHVYQVYVRIKDEEWNVYRRYSEFYMLHKNLKKRFPSFSALEFPPKKTIGNKHAKVVQERREKLENYLRSIMHIIQVQNDVICVFSK